ncbi:hypothetical protein VNO77_14852 [Canavalia gladiata]|uniref:Uncharacterized protein n=1 Tax=Canavalia gladiata TaxID=3824 RepID=A0AAN9QNW6_CANGL
MGTSSQLGPGLLLEENQSLVWPQIQEHDCPCITHFTRKFSDEPSTFHEGRHGLRLPLIEASWFKVPSASSKKRNQRDTLSLPEFYGYSGNSKAGSPTCISKSRIDAATLGFIKDCHFPMKTGPTIEQQWHTQMISSQGSLFMHTSNLYVTCDSFPIPTSSRLYMPVSISAQARFSGPSCLPLDFSNNCSNPLYYFLTQWCMSLGRRVDYVLKGQSW